MKLQLPTGASGADDAKRVLRHAIRRHLATASITTSACVLGIQLASTAHATPVLVIDHKLGFGATDFADLIANDVLTSAQLNAAATAHGIAFSIPGSGNHDASVSADAQATGIDAKAGNDNLSRSIVTDARSTAIATGAAVTGSLTGASTVNSNNTATATTTGITGGSDDDEIHLTNSVADGKVKVESNASATGVNIALTIDTDLLGALDAPEASIAGKTTATATSTGLDGGAGVDVIDNRAAMEVIAHSTATSVGVQVGVGMTRSGNNTTVTNPDATVASSSLSDAATQSRSDANAIAGGDGRDTLDNSGTLTLTSSADVTAVKVALDIAGSVEGDASGKPISDSSAGATASLTGIAGGNDIDTITNRGAINGNATATATSVGVTAGVAIAESGDVTSNGVSDASVTTTANANGLDGGSGADTVTNLGALDLHATSTSRAVTASLTVAGTLKGSPNAEAESKSTTLATANSSGMHGGDGDDVLDNRGAGATIATTSTATTTAVGVGLSISGQISLKDDSTETPTANAGNDKDGDADDVSIKGKSVSNSRATANAYSTGIAGDAGADTITNDANLTSIANATGTAVTVSGGAQVNVGIDVDTNGDVEGSALSNSSVNANTAAIGIDGGDDTDSLTNRGNVTSTATSNATGVAASLNVAGNIAYKAEKKDEGGTTPTATDDDNDEEDKPSELKGEALTDSSVAATASSIGLTGGAGNDTTTNDGVLQSIVATANATGVSAAVGLSAGVGVNTDASVNVSGAAVSKADVTANSDAVAMSGGAGSDTLTNSRELTSLRSDATATGVAASLSVSGLFSYKGNVSGDVTGEAASDAGTHAIASATALDGGAGDDQIYSRGLLGTLHAEAKSTGIAAALGITAGLAINGDAKDVKIEGKSAADASSNATANATAIDGGSGIDNISQTAGITRIESLATATGVAASVNIAGTVAYKGSTDATVKGQAVSDTSVSAQATAAAIDGGSDADTITNQGVINSIYAKSNATGVAASANGTFTVTVGDDNAKTKANLEGHAVSRSDVLADATALGISGGDGNDAITNSGALSAVQSVATSTGVSASLGVTASVTVKGDTEADITGDSLSNTSAASHATTTALSGDAGNDSVMNSGALNLLADADSTGIAASLNVAAAVTFKGSQQANVTGSAASNASVTASALATGIAGGAGEDHIQNTATIDMLPGNVSATATSVAATLNVAGNLAIKGTATGNVAATSATNSSATADTIATAIDGGADNDDIRNSGALNVRGNANSTGVSASLTVAGNMSGETTSAALSETVVTARSTGVGIAGGAGDDLIGNRGNISLFDQTQPDAKAVGVAVTLNVGGTIKGDVQGDAVSNAQTLASTHAAGIDGGDGADFIGNSGAITARVNADADSVSITVQPTITAGGSVSGAAVADARAIASASASGVAAGAGDDTIKNNVGANLDLVTASDATAAAVTVALSGAVRGEAEGTALANSATLAQSQSIGLDGGAGTDSIDAHSASIVTHAAATTHAVGVGVSITGAVGLASGGAAADASATSDAYSAAVDGGAGIDHIDNTSAIQATAQSSANASGTSVGITFADGVASNVVASNAAATATTTIAALAGGDDNDEITNVATLFAGGKNATTVAQATSGSTSVGITLGRGYVAGSTAATSASLAQADVYGLSGGSGADRLDNRGAITIAAATPAAGLARANASSTSVTTSVAAGISVSQSQSDASTTARIDAAALNGGAGDDTVLNSGTLTVGQQAQLAIAHANANTVSVGVTAGGSLSDSSANSAAVADTVLAGIAGGTGSDHITNSGDIRTGVAALNLDKTTFDANVMTTAQAASRTTTVTVAVGGSFQTSASDASATATNRAAAIAGGADNDVIVNTGNLNAYSSAGTRAESNNSSATFTLGASLGNATSNSSATATAISAGIDGGDGADDITTARDLTAQQPSRSDINVGAWSVSLSNSTTNSLTMASAGATLNSVASNSSATSDAQARGIDGGGGADHITLGSDAAATDDELNVAATSLVFSESRSSSITGPALGAVIQQAQSQANTLGHALAVGIDSGSGNDTLLTASAMEISANTGGESKSTSAATSAFTLAGATDGESVASAQTSLIAEAVGIRGGAADDTADADTIHLIAPASVTATAAGTSTSTATSASKLNIFGPANGKAAADASATVLATATGIEGGADRDEITTQSTEDRSGSLTVTTQASAAVNSTAKSNAAVAFGDASSMGVSNAAATIAAESLGLDGGAGDDTITSGATVRVNSHATGNITANSQVNADVAFGAASSGAASDASARKYSHSAGIDGGAGADTINNNALLAVSADTGGTVTSTSTANAGAFFRSASSNTLARAALEGITETQGILAGDGNDIINNAGTVSSLSNAQLNVASLSFATAHSTFSSASARANSSAAATGAATALGVAGGAGNDTVTNTGVIDASASSNTAMTTASIAIASSTFGGEYTTASTSNYAASNANASGIEGGDGNDTVNNNKLLNVAANASIAVTSLTVSSDGPAATDARTIAAADAAGISGGAGADALTNTSTVLVSARPRVTTATRTQGGQVSGLLGVDVDASAAGLRGGDDNDSLTNSGALVVMVGRQLDATLTTASASGAVAIRDAARVGTNADTLIGKWVRIDLPTEEDLYTTVVAFDAATGTLTLADPLPQSLAIGARYTVLDASDGIADVGATSLTTGGAVNVNAALNASVTATGMSGDAGNDTVTNTGSIRTVGANDIRIGSVTVGGNVTANLRSTSDVTATALAGETVVNQGSADVAANALLRAVDTSFAISGVTTDRRGIAQAATFGIAGDTSLANTITNAGVLTAGATSEVRSLDRVLAIFSGANQQLTFESDSNAIGIGGATAGDVVTNANNGRIDVNSAAVGTIQGVSTTFFLFSNVRRTENLVAATVDASAYGYDLSAGANNVTNSGALNVHALAGPSEIAVAGLNDCGTRACLARAVADQNNETSARAQADATARAWGLHAAGADTLTNAGSMDVLATAVATSYAQAANIVGAQDQSGITAILDTTHFTDRTLQGIAAADLIGKQLRFPGAPQLDFLDAQSTIGSIAKDSGGKNTNSFTDTSYQGANPVGMRVRFADGGNFVATVTAYNATTGVFTLTNNIPDAVAATEDYSLSVLTARITAFDSATGEVTLSHALPTSIVAGDSYTLSIVSGIAGANSFTDSTRVGEHIPVGTVVTFDGVPNFSATLSSFDSATGTFTLSNTLPPSVTSLDMYSLSIDESDGESGAVAHAFSTGVELGDGGANVISSGTLTVRATATADTRAVARAGSVVAATAESVAEAYGIRSGTGNDRIVNSGVMDIGATSAATSSTTSLTNRVLAIGIDTGDGNDSITNSGELHVAAALAAGSSGNLQLDVTGIRSGAGNDTVINTGTIDSSNQGFTAIDTSDGDDQAVFGARSVTIGSVSLGAGDDAVTLNGGARIERVGNVLGSLDAGTGTDSLIVAGSGSYNGVVTSFERLAKHDVGTFTLAALPTMQQLNIDAGVIRVNSSYTFASNGSYAVPIAGNGSHGQLSIAGNTTLGGALTVTRQGGPFMNGTTFDLVTADQGITAGSTFSTVQLPSATGLVKFRYQQGANTVQVVTDVASFTSFAGDPLQNAVSEHLDRLLPQSSGELRNLIEHLQLQPASALPADYAALSPMHYGVTQRFTLDNVTQQLFGLQHHMTTLRLEGLNDAAQYRGTYVPAMPMRMGRLITPLRNNASAVGMLDNDLLPSRNGLWTDVSGSSGTRDAADGYDGYDVGTHRYTVGFDVALGEQWLLGLSATRSNSDVTFDTSTSLSEQRFNFYTVYGSWISDRAYIDGSILYGTGEQKDVRPVNIVGFANRIGTSIHDIAATAYSLDGAYNFGNGSWAFGPTAGLRYVTTREDAFTETGAGDLSLQVAKQNAEALTAEAGLRLWRSVGRDRNTFVPELGVTWVHDFDVGDTNVDTAFVGAPTQRFVSPGQRAERNGARVSLGLGYVSRGGLSTLLRYTGEFRGSVAWHGIQGQLRYDF